MDFCHFKNLVRGSGYFCHYDNLVCGSEYFVTSKFWSEEYFSKMDNHLLYLVPLLSSSGHQIFMEVIFWQVGCVWSYHIGLTWFNVFFRWWFVSFSSFRVGRGKFEENIGNTIRNNNGSFVVHKDKDRQLDCTQRQRQAASLHTKTKTGSLVVQKDKDKDRYCDWRQRQIHALWLYTKTKTRIVIEDKDKDRYITLKMKTNTGVVIDVHKDKDNEGSLHLHKDKLYFPLARQSRRITCTQSLFLPS